MTERSVLSRLLSLALRVAPNDSDIEALRALARDPSLEWPALAASLEMHGVLGLALRNLDRARDQGPRPWDAAVETRREVQRRDAGRGALTLSRFLAATTARGVETVLLKGASLATDVYPEPGLRSQGDLDVLVRPARVRDAVLAAQDAGLAYRESQFPLWWYRLVHFHAKLHPTSSLLQELEVHWRLSSPALLLTPPADLWDRAHVVVVDGHRTKTLHPVDRYLHLVTHLISHGSALPRNDGNLLADLVLAPLPAVRIKWIVDLAAASRLLAEDVAPAVLASRALPWGAGRALGSATRMLDASGLIDGELSLWHRELLERLQDEDRGVSTTRPLRESRRPSGGFDFRVEALLLWPRWFAPPLGYLTRRYGLGRGTGGRILAAAVFPFHALGVLVRSIAACAALPVAHVGRRLLARSRRARHAAALEPDRVIELVTAWRLGSADDRGRKP